MTAQPTTPADKAATRVRTGGGESGRGVCGWAGVSASASRRACDACGCIPPDSTAVSRPLCREKASRSQPTVPVPWRPSHSTHPLWHLAPYGMKLTKQAIPPPSRAGKLLSQPTSTDRESNRVKAPQSRHNLQRVNHPKWISREAIFSGNYAMQCAARRRGRSRRKSATTLLSQQISTPTGEP